MQINRWLLTLILLAAAAFVFIRIRGIWLNLRAYDFVSKEIRAAEEAALLQHPDIEIFYTKNLDAQLSFQRYDPLYVAVSFFHSRRYLERWINYDAHQKAEIVRPEELPEP